MAGLADSLFYKRPEPQMTPANPAPAQAAPPAADYVPPGAAATPPEPSAPVESPPSPEQIEMARDAAGLAELRMRSRPGPAVRIPGQAMAEVSQVFQQSGEQAAPGKEAEYRAAEGDILEAQKNQIDIEEQANEDAGINRALQIDAQQQADERNQAVALQQATHRQINQAARRQEVDGQMRLIAQAMDQRAELLARNPRAERWANASTGERIMGILGVLAGGFAAGPNGENRALAQINNAIAEDIARNRSVADAMGQRTADLRYQLGEMRQLWTDDDAADAAEYATMLRKADSEVARMESSATTDANRAKFKVAREELRKQAAEKEKQAMALQYQKNWQKTQDRVVQAPGMSDKQAYDEIVRRYGQEKAPEYYRAYKLGGVPSAKAEAPRMTSEEKNAREMESKDVERTVRLPDYLGGGFAFAPSGPQATTTNDSIQAMETIMANDDAIHRIRKQAAGRPFTPAEIGQIDDIAKSSEANMGIALRLGALSDGDRELTRPYSSTASGERFNARSSEEILANARQLMRNKIQGLTRNLRTGPGLRDKYFTPTLGTTRKRD